MGLDWLDLTFKIEHHFGITLQPSECGHVRTVGDLVAIIQTRIDAANREDVAANAFCQVQRVVRQVTNDPALNIQPDERVADRLDVPQRRALWKELESSLKQESNLEVLHLDDLELPRLLRHLLLINYLGILGFIIWLSVTYTGHYLFLGAIFLIAVIVISYRLLSPFRNTPPARWDTFGKLSLRLVSLTAATKHLELRDADEILTELRPLIVNTIGCKSELVTLDARFVETLGLN